MSGTQQRSHDFRRDFFVGADGGNRTHNLLITNYDSFVSPISVNARKVLCCKASGVFVFRGISPIWAGFG